MVGACQISPNRNRQRRHSLRVTIHNILESEIGVFRDKKAVLDDLQESKSSVVYETDSAASYKVIREK